MVRSQAAQGILADGGLQRLVEDAEHHNNILPLRLRDELGEDTDVVERALSVGVTHSAIEEVEFASLATVVVSCVECQATFVLGFCRCLPLADPGTAWRSRLTRIPYFLHHWRA
mgnify:CR=1 FL=1